jgi:hypothetical protein
MHSVCAEGMSRLLSASGAVATATDQFGQQLPCARSKTQVAGQKNTNEQLGSRQHVARRGEFAVPTRYSAGDVDLAIIGTRPTLPPSSSSSWHWRPAGCY